MSSANKGIYWMVGGTGENGDIIRAWTDRKIDSEGGKEKAGEYVLLVFEGNYFTLSNIGGMSLLVGVFTVNQSINQSIKVF
jgi:hypothetical protein